MVAEKEVGSTSSTSEKPEGEDSKEEEEEESSSNEKEPTEGAPDHQTLLLTDDQISIDVDDLYPESDASKDVQQKASSPKKSPQKSKPAPKQTQEPPGRFSS